MLLAPYSGSRNPSLGAERDDVGAVSPRTLHRRNVEAQDVAGVLCAADVERGVTLMTRHACSLEALAQLARLLVPDFRYLRDAFDQVQALGVPKLRLWGPDGARKVNPVVGRRALERFARFRRSAFGLLLLLVLALQVIGELLLQLLLLLLALALLLARGLG